MTFVEKKMAALLARNWWVLLLRGILSLGFGVLLWTQPGISLAALVLFFGIYTLAEGALDIWIAITQRKERGQWWILLIQGLLGLGIGVLALAMPGITAFVFLLYIAIWAITTGILEIVTAIRLRKEIEHEWSLILSGFASLVFGLILVVRPGAGILTLLWLIAAYAVIFGILLIVLAFKARRFAKESSDM